MKVIDLQLNIDGLLLEDDETVEDYIRKLQEVTNSNYNIIYDILHCELVNDESIK